MADAKRAKNPNKEETTLTPHDQELVTKHKAKRGFRSRGEALRDLIRTGLKTEGLIQ